MADSHQILLDKTKTRGLIGDVLEADLPDKPTGATKRLFHERSSVVQAHENCITNHENGDESLLSGTTNSRFMSVALKDGDTKAYSGEDIDPEFPAEKRPRTSDWPLRSSNAGSEAPSRPRGALGNRYDTLNSASLHPRASAQLRPSKFVEGSMNDRASQRPHPVYIGDSEEPWERFGAEQNAYDSGRKKPQLGGVTYHTNRSMALLVANDKSEVARPSTIFRFGKSVVAAFNPSSWKIWSKQQGDEDNQEKTTLKERHEKAGKIYKELKRTGHLKDYEYEAQIQVQDMHKQHKKHDSGVHLGHHASKNSTAYGIGSMNFEPKVEEKRYGRIFLNSPSVASLARSDSPASEIPMSLRNSSFHLPEALEQVNGSSNGPQALRRLPSRKDLQKQQKLVKRVSDLEGKLDAARRQLAEALGEPVPTQATGISRSHFIPGALPSLPSERLLGVYAPPEAETDSDASVEVGRALSIDNGANAPVSNHNSHKSGTEGPIRTISRSSGTPTFENTLVNSSKSIQNRNPQKSDLQVAEDSRPNQPVEDASQETSNTLMPTSQPKKKRKSIGPGIADDVKKYGSAPNSDGENSSEAPKTPILESKPGRPRKLQKVDPEARSLRVEPNESKHSVPGDFMEEKDSGLSQGRKIRSPKDELVVLGKRAASSITTSLIPQKGCYSASPPPMSSTSITYTGQEARSGRNALQDDEGRDPVCVAPSAEVPPVPQIPGVRMAKVQTKAIPGSKKIPRSDRETGTHDEIALNQMKLEISNADKERSKGQKRQPFEWPEDVF